MAETLILKFLQDNGSVKLESLLDEFRKHSLSDSDIKAALWRLVAASAVDLRPDNTITPKQATSQSV